MSEKKALLVKNFLPSFQGYKTKSSIEFESKDLNLL